MIVKIPVFLSSKERNKAHFLAIGYSDMTNDVRSLNEAGKALAYLIHTSTGSSVQDALMEALQEMNITLETGSYQEYQDVLKKYRRIFEKFAVDDRGD